MDVYRGIGVSMFRYRISADYVGTAYGGWQVQPNRKTVQGEIEKAVFELTGEKTSVVGSGRTDASVHALCQTAHFDLSKEWEPKRLVGGLNHFLASDIRVLNAQKTRNDFHARFDCVEKSYIYLMYRAPERAVLTDRAWAVDPNIDVGRMKSAAKRFVGEKDFKSFMAGGSDTASSIRRVSGADVYEKDGFIVFETTANGFLYNMVRIMTSAVEAAGRGKLTETEIDDLIAAKDRTQVKGTAPAFGLYLKSQKYKEE